LLQEINPLKRKGPFGLKTVASVFLDIILRNIIDNRMINAIY